MRIARWALIPGTLVVAFAGAAGEPPRTGPKTEDRFPPLKLPTGFKATLFACDPFIEYPSVIAAGPRASSLFVAIDYMTGLGEEIVRRDEVRLIEDTDGDGYADRSTVYAAGFNSIQGLAYHDGRVYVMHAPFLTVLRDTKGTGVADERKDLLKGLGLTPEQNQTRLHCANGVVVGHDGWLYLAMGDNGTDVKRPEGDRLVLNGGGILRCRADGRDLHVFATGLRNIYDVALDADLNVFVRDNENDGGDYKVRVCHSFFGADHGYPYLYHERPDEALPPLADVGLGSSAGGVCYLERGFPPEYRGDLFFCEWGRSVVRYRPRPAGSAFGPLKEHEFATAAENDPYGFKPTDLVIHRDGALFVSDWADGQRPKRGRGRIYRITAVEPPKPAERTGTGLDSESYSERVEAQLTLESQAPEGLKTVRRLLADGKLTPRGRMHAIWVVAHNDGTKALDDLLAVAKFDPDSGVRVQAVRAIADLTDPVFVKHKLDSGSGDATVATKLAALAEDGDARLQREVVVALGRLRWSGTSDWLAKHLTRLDAPLAHAAMWAMRTAGDWPAVLKLLDRPANDAVRPIAMRSVAGQFDLCVIDGLIERLKSETDATRRVAYADLLTRVHRKAGPWEYWGYRPGPRPANPVDWDRSPAIVTALDHAFAGLEPAGRLAVLTRMRREKVPVRPIALIRWLRDERGEEAVGVILEVLGAEPAAETRAALAAVVREKGYGTGNRLRALTLLADDAGPLLDLARGLDHGPVLAEVLRRIGRVSGTGKPAAEMLCALTTSTDAKVRAAAVETLGELRAADGREPALRLLADRAPEVRRAAAVAAGKLDVRSAAESLLKLTVDPDASVRHASFIALRRLREPRTVPAATAALEDRETQLVALDLLGELGGPDQAAAVVAVARRAPPVDVLAGVVRVLSAWADHKNTPTARREQLERSIAEVHGTTGAVVRWTVSGKADGAALPDGRPRLAAAPDWRLTGGPADVAWFAQADVAVPEATAVEFALNGAGTAEVWVNGKSVFHRAEARTDRNAVARFPGAFAKGPNRVRVRIGAATEFGLTFRRAGANADHERLTRAALTRTGNVERGRAVFFDADKSLCARCHRAGDRGERVGPELTGLGTRFGRAYLVESILEPGRSVVPGFATIRIDLADGRVVTGVKTTESDTTVTLVDPEVKTHELKKADVLDRRAVATSAMPDGLEKRLTEQEFVDLVAYLVSLKDRAPSK